MTHIGQNNSAEQKQAANYDSDVMEKAPTNTPLVKGFFDPSTSTISYIVSCRVTKKAVIIDSVLDYNPRAGRIHYDSANTLLAYIKDNGLICEYILETHAHADHISAAQYLKEKLGASIVIHEAIQDTQKSFAPVFNLGSQFPCNGSQFDKLLKDEETLKIGQLDFTCMHTPGHTPACATYIIGNAIFVGDTLFMPDSGTARTDFPGGDAATLYQSIHKILSLPQDYKIFVCHDYQPGGRAILFETTVAEQRQKNIHIGGGTSQEDFVKMRTTRDATLDQPNLIIPSIQVNVRAGQFPEPEDNDVVYLKIPVNQL